MSGAAVVTPEPAQRFVIAQSWWIASEIVRRHPELRIVETHPGGGQYDCLTLAAGTHANPSSLIDLNRVGSIHVHTDSSFEALRWNEVLTARGGHDVVRAVESAAGLTAPRQAPATGPRTLIYRLLARTLTSLVDDRHAWDARSGQVDSSGYGGGARPELEQFPSVVEELRSVHPDDLFGLPAYRFWILLRGQDPLAVLDTDGHAHFTDRPPHDLLPVYRRCGRSLMATLGAAIGHLLP